MHAIDRRIALDRKIRHDGAVELHPLLLHLSRRRVRPGCALLQVRTIGGKKARDPLRELRGDGVAAGRRRGGIDATGGRHEGDELRSLEAADVGDRRGAGEADGVQRHRRQQGVLRLTRQVERNLLLDSELELAAAERRGLTAGGGGQHAVARRAIGVLDALGTGGGREGKQCGGQQRQTSDHLPIRRLELRRLHDPRYTRLEA